MAPLAGFPWWSFATGVLGAVALALLRHYLARRAEPVVARRRMPWQPRDAAGLLVAVGVALALRAIGVSARAVDNDEPVGLGMSGLDFWAAQDDARLHPPLPAMLMTWAGGGEADLDAARDVSVMAGVAMVALVYGITRRRGRAAAIIAALTVSVAPALVHASQLARGYALLGASVLALHACVNGALATGRERWWLSTTLVATLALLTEYLALFAVAAELVAGLWASRGDARRAVGLLTSLGGALAAASFLAPIAWPSLDGGIGGGPHAPIGLPRAIDGALETFGGALGWLGGAAVLFALGVIALRERDPDRSALRLALQLVLLLTAYGLAATATEVRPRYLLHALPLLSVVLAASRTPALAGALLLGAHAALLPSYLVDPGRLGELSTGPRLRRMELALSGAQAVAVAPAWAMAETSWRLARAFPPAGRARDCPADLCVVTDRRRIYGISSDLTQVDAVRAREPVLWLVLRRGVTGRLPDQCRLLFREADATLWRCTR